MKIEIQANWKSNFKKASIILSIIFSIVFIWINFNKVIQPQVKNKDFSVYYYCAKAYSNGVNPYDNSSVEENVGKAHVYHYAYPPITLKFFQAFTKFNFDFATWFFFFLKFSVIIAVIILWRNLFLDRKVDFIFYLLCLFSYNTTIYCDLLLGNISILEQLFLWLGFFYYLRNRIWLFGLLIILASIFKATNILFLGLLIFKEDKKRFFYLWTLVGIFITTLVIQFFIFPADYMCVFITRLFMKMRERGPLNSCLPMLVNDLTGYLSNSLGVEINSNIILAILNIAIILVSYFFAKRIAKSKDKEKDKILIFLGCFTYILLLPRCVLYFYILLIPGTYYLMQRANYLNISYLLFILIFIFNPFVCLTSLQNLSSILFSNSPILITAFFWGICLYEIKKRFKR